MADTFGVGVVIPVAVVIGDARFVYYLGNAAFYGADVHWASSASCGSEEENTKQSSIVALSQTFLNLIILWENDELMKTLTEKYKIDQDTAGKIVRLVTGMSENPLCEKLMENLSVDSLRTAKKQTTTQLSPRDFFFDRSTILAPELIVNDMEQLSNMLASMNGLASLFEPLYNQLVLDARAESGLDAYTKIHRVGLIQEHKWLQAIVNHGDNNQVVEMFCTNLPGAQTCAETYDVSGVGVTVSRMAIEIFPAFTAPPPYDGAQPPPPPYSEIER